MKMKVCKKCNQEKPLDDFYKNSRYKDGHVTTCKRCYKENLKGNLEKSLGNANIDKNNPLAIYTNRQLLEEIKKRGYRGCLQFTREVNLDQL